MKRNLLCKPFLSPIRSTGQRYIDLVTETRDVSSFEHFEPVDLDGDIVMAPKGMRPSAIGSCVMEFHDMS